MRPSSTFILLSATILVTGLSIGVHTWQASVSPPLIAPRTPLSQPEPYAGPKPLERSTNPNELSGFLVDIEENNGRITLVIDQAELFLNQSSTEYSNGLRLTDDQKAALDDRGLVMPETQRELDGLILTSGPFYIRNNSTSTRELVFASNAKIRVHVNQRETKNMTTKQFVQAFKQAQIQGRLSSLMEFSSLAHLTLKNNVIIELRGDSSP